LVNGPRGIPGRKNKYGKPIYCEMHWKWPGIKEIFEEKHKMEPFIIVDVFERGYDDSERNVIKKSKVAVSNIPRTGR
jgi:hypothetical protein